MPFRPCCAALLLAAVGAAQAASPAPVPKLVPPALHRPQLQLPPLLALQHLQQGNLLFRQAVARRQPPPQPPARPAGAGRYVAAVVVCADAGVDAPYLFSLLPRDVLLLSLPGPCRGAEAVAALERAVAGERLSLVVVLAHAGCASCEGEAATPSQRALQRRTQAARELAAARQLPLCEAQARTERELLLAQSELLRQQVAAGSLMIAPATVEPQGGLVTFHLSRAEQMPLPPVAPPRGGKPLPEPAPAPAK